MLILGLLGMYFDAAVVFVTSQTLFLRLALAILWVSRQIPNGSHNLYFSGLNHLLQVKMFEIYEFTFFQQNNLSKGQLISKGIFGVFNSSKKQTKTSRLEVS
jgi:hypothetical protein